MIPRRQPTYEDNLSEDEDDAETMLQGNRRGGQREPDRQTSDYMDIPEDKKVKLVAYRLLRGAFAWWEQLQITRLRQGKGWFRHGLK
jgi:hypothetical protein